MYLKRVIAIYLCLVMILGLVACSSKTIGSVSGAENEYITIDSAKYVLDTANSFSSADKGKFLGKVSNSALTMKVYSVKGDTEGKYIYALWDWEGAFYIKQE